MQSAALRPKGVVGAFPEEQPGHTCKRSFAKKRLKVKPGDSGHSRVANADPVKVKGEPLHLAVANWRCRPMPAGQQLKTAVIRRARVCRTWSMGCGMSTASTAPSRSLTKTGC